MTSTGANQTTDQTTGQQTTDHGGRTFTPVDDMLCRAQTLLQLFCQPASTRPCPGDCTRDGALTDADKQHSGRYMRVNHVGEVCAQALYQSQALTTRNEQLRRQLEQASAEELDHLAWCEQRLMELGGRKSYLNPFWYAGSFAIGTVAGLAGDRWSLGFVAETEKQVEAHLEKHLGMLPPEDLRSRAIISRMKEDESQHAQQAKDAGAAELPPTVTKLMQLAAGTMTRTAYWL